MELMNKNRPMITFMLFTCRALAFGRGSTEPVRGAKLPKVEKLDPWDGKDGEVKFMITYWCQNSYTKIHTVFVVL